MGWNGEEPLGGDMPGVGGKLHMYEDEEYEEEDEEDEEEDEDDESDESEDMVDTLVELRS